MDGRPRILIVDDEIAIADLVARMLAREGMETRCSHSGAQALKLFHEEDFDLAIIDIMMPGMDGFELCSRMRATSEIPIMFLSAKDEENDQVVGFALGADDYVTKPFKQRELVARVKARLRRAQADRQAVDSHLFRAGNVEVDVISHTAALYGEPLKLTPKEFDILSLLVKEVGSPVSTRTIFETVWGEPYDASAGNTVMVHIRHLRAKLAEIDSSSTFIETTWGVGYKMLDGRH